MMLPIFAWVNEILQPDEPLMCRQFQQQIAINRDGVKVGSGLMDVGKKLDALVITTAHFLIRPTKIALFSYHQTLILTLLDNHPVLPTKVTLALPEHAFGSATNRAASIHPNRMVGAA